MRLFSSAVTTVALSCLLAGCRSRAASDADIKTELVTLEHQLAAAYLKHDTAFVNRFIADDWIGITPSGKTEGKAQAISDIGSPDYNMESAHLDITNVRVFGDSAVVTV